MKALNSPPNKWIPIEPLHMNLKRRKRRLLLTTLSLLLLTVLLALATLMIGKTTYSLGTLYSVIRGQDNSGADFPISTLRLPRMLIGMLSGFSFGIAGRTFQKMLRNPLASPDIIGITSGSSVSAVFAILVLHLDGTIVSFISVISGLATALVIYLLSGGGQFSGGRLILIGIGIQAMIGSVISYLLLSASQYDVPSAMRWLSGSLSTMKLTRVPPLLIIVLICTTVIILFEKHLQILELGELSAITLGVKTNQVRLILILSAVFLLAFATSVTGPIAFVSFLSGPIATKICNNTNSELPSGFIGAILVLSADFIGQNLLDTALPAGVITGIIGAPYLIFLLIQLNKHGGLR